jgi:hypothetical protein
MPNNLLLLPQPHQITYLDGALALSNHQLIVLDGPIPQSLTFTARRLQQALRQEAGVEWQIVAAIPAGQIGLKISVAPGGISHPQGYQLTISPAGIFIIAGTPAGAFYASQTLSQILKQCGQQLPLLRIRDWPDFPHRGVMLDIARDKVPTMETLFNLVEMLASWKINQLQLYTEHTFAYQHHREVWAEASPLTGEEILALDAYCRERFVELIPNQNSFGHMHRWLSHAQYNHLAECPDGCDTDWGHFDKPFGLCPQDPGSLELLRSLMDELLPHFSSRQFNVGCDETIDLGRGRSRQVVAEKGRGRVYLDFLLKIYREVKARGRAMQFWGDIIMTHPELVAELPRDVIALEWGYEADHPFAEHGAKFAASGIPFYVCPGTSSWNTLAGRTNNALENLRNAAENGLKHGAIGYLITDWGDRGHWQPLPVSYLGFVYGSALAWGYDANRELDVAQATSMYAFNDSAGVMGLLAYNLGNLYLQPGKLVHNSSLLFWILQERPHEILARAGVTEQGLQTSLTYLDRIMPSLDKAQINRADADLIRREFAWAAEMLRHACRRGMWVLNQKEDVSLRQQLAQEADTLLDEHRAIWLARNREGGLRDSAARLEKMRADYHN